ncbi:hypothetical protein GCWU000341_02009 [Oribacterium sp. oral taxon 078 str. F0262]|nr:hypothetical protein GCWU000341_02009 [Oribacterium sp. oral taxon 078 str. F0262]
MMIPIIFAAKFFIVTLFLIPGKAAPPPAPAFLPLRFFGNSVAHFRSFEIYETFTIPADMTALP